MFSSLFLKKESTSRTTRVKIMAIFLLALMVFSLLAFTKPVQAQTVTSDTQTVVQTALSKVWDTLKKLLIKAGSFAFQKTLSSALNKISYDTANYLGSGGEGQKPLFITQDWGEYLTQVGDEAMGQFVESFASSLSQDTGRMLNGPGTTNCDEQFKECSKCLQLPIATCNKTCTDQLTECKKQIDVAATNTNASSTNKSLGSVVTSLAGGAISSFNVCQPSSLDAKVKITLGLVDQSRPQVPTCKATQIVKNWSDPKTLVKNNPNFLEDFKDIFDPRGNDLGIYVTAQSDMGAQAAAGASTKKTELETKGGWLDVKTIAGGNKGVPDAAKAEKEKADQIQNGQIGKITEDILIDTANIFLNQLAMSAFNNLMQSLGKKATTPENPSFPGINNQESDVSVLYGEASFKESIAKFFSPQFGSRADYEILSQLAVCLDAQNPSPTNCALDNQFMQGITEKKTVAEAIKEGYLNGSWQFTADTQPSSYSLRNLSILRKYRIIPVGWEVAIERMAENPNVTRKATMNDLVSCFDQNDAYNQFSADFNTRDQGWCQGLVDPNWVLKAPLNYCKKQGVSSQILTHDSIPGIKGVSGVADTLSVFTVTRADEYCADEETCIKEKSDGSCEAYGYCNEEKRIWNFGEDSCEPVYNTCQSFNNTSNNQKVSYLKNTLDYSSCDANSAGCRQYALYGNYVTSTGTMAWSTNRSQYFNRNLPGCSEKDDGCTEMLRVKPTWGSNLVMNADFANDAVGASSTGAALLNEWPYWSSSNSNGASRQATIVDASLEPGSTIGKALKLEVDGPVGQQIVLGTFSNFDSSLLPKNLQIIPGQSYTLSADVYLAEGTKAHVFVGDAADGFISSVDQKNGWQHLTITRPPRENFSEASFGINGDSMTGRVVLYVKNIKFEMSDWDTGYNSYGAYKINEKIIPPYLEKACYADATSASKDYRFRDDAPSICFNYARKCNRDEVGCDLYTATKGNFSIPAKVASTDYCPSQCLGYDVYVSRETNFNSPQAENLIPETAQVCNAEAVGCNEFTNLDELVQGGEKKEYYNYLKQCIKPTQGDCASFYAWEGTGTGYQLKVYTLQEATTGQPQVTADDSALCNATIYNLPLTDSGYNSDCREFYNQAGQVSYHLMSRTITCSENCHAYRLTEKNIDKRLTANQCVGADKNWDATLNNCYVCLNGGLWNTDHQACVYQAIPGEGKTCDAANNGCREYNGNSGNNTRLAASFDYETGKQGWYSNCGNAGLSVSTIANSKNGHSLAYNSNAPTCLSIGEEGGAAAAKRQRIIEELLAASNVGAQLKVNDFVSQGNAYSVRFLARAANDSDVEIYFLNKDTGEKAYFNGSSTLKIKGGNEWAVYQANLEILDHKIGSSEILVMAGSASFYFDDFTLTEITDRYYLIKNSSQVPDICYYDIFDNYQGAEYNLGCAQYTDRSNLAHNLHRFSKVCSDSAVGCEQMIDTKNYDLYGSGIWKDTNENKVCDADEPDCLTVSGDTALYAVYDIKKQCNTVDVGCTRLGKGQGTGENIVWSDVFKKNNPNLYSQTLCGQAEVGCEEWRSGDDNSSSYFRDPGINTCVYRASQDPTSPGKAWYKIPVKRCDINSSGQIEGVEKGGKVCTTSADCGEKPCVIDNNDYPCSVSYFKTIGLGGGGNQIPTPDQEAGLCEASNSGCTEYIDPVSQFSPNLLYNPSYQLINNNYEGWSGATPQQEIKIKPNKLYILNTKYSNNGAGDVRLTFTTGVKPLLIDNTFGTTTNSVTITAGQNQPILFNSLGNSKTLVIGGTTTKTIEVKEAVVDYQLIKNLDKTSCNGAVKFDNGCVLFNERAVNSQTLANLSKGWDAYKTQDGTSPLTCDATKAGSCTANQLIKVRPNRICAKWLDCLTYVVDPATKQRTCYAVGECDRLNDKGECANFIDTTATGNRQFDIFRDRNATGYSLIDKYYLNQMKEVGLNSEAHYDFEDSVPALSCRRAGTTGECNFDKNIVIDSVVREPDKAPTDYPAHGKSYLKVPSAYELSPMSKNTWLSLAKESTYFINYLLNTKNSGLAGKVTIELKSTSNAITKKSFQATANNGWERKISNFTTASDTTAVRIYLGSDSPANKGYVYFDDINIEPVLEIAGNGSTTEYVARECRLYPTADSLTCLSKNNEVVNDGWEGYCLEHDKNNKDVCLLWYPVDRISSANTGQAKLGYTGKFPLNYCTEANGSFSLVEKRLAQRVYTASNDEYDGVYCYYASASDIPLSSPAGEYCTNNHGATTNTNNIKSFIDPGQVKAWCQTDKNIGDSFDYFVLHVFGWGDKSTFCMPLKKNQVIQMDQPNFVIQNNGFKTEYKVYYSGWFNYNGLSKNNKTKSPTESCETGPCEYSFDESKKADPPIRVYDYDHPPADEEGLKLVSGSDKDQVYSIVCNRFTQVVDSDGQNKAWANRVSKDSSYATQTPPFFIDDSNKRFDATPYNLARYGRNRQDTPFGAAAWPDDFDLLSSEPIKFRGQYSKNETVFAGRPFGCANGTGVGCSNIGACSLDPSVYCLYSSATGSANFDLNRKSCADGGYGTCTPLWSNYPGVRSTDYRDILRSLFLKPYNDYYYDKTIGAYSPSSLTSNFPDYTVPPENPPFPFVQECTNTTRTNNGNIASFCAIFPEISNVKLKLGNTLIGTTIFNIQKKGVYSLEFNTKIDNEQQPMKRIYINWGDGGSQVITGQDHRPSADNPHIFYHYYNSTGVKSIQIIIFDNWGFYKTFCSSGVCGPSPFQNPVN